MINRRITILGPEGTNIYVIFQYLIFCVISWFTLFNITNEIGLDIQNVLVRQITFTLIGLIVFFLFTYVSISNIFGLSYVLMVSSTILLIGVLFTEESLGARRRYDLGVFDFQPSEFTKIAFVIFLVSVFSQKRINLFSTRSWNNHHFTFSCIGNVFYIRCQNEDIICIFNYAIHFIFYTFRI